MPPTIRRANSFRLSRPVSAALAIAFVSRIALASIVWFALRVFPRHAPYPVQLPDSFLPNHRFLDGWARWDAAHYVAIAQHGYGSSNPSPHGGLGFFPLYPLMMRGFVELFRLNASPQNLAIAGIVISNVCFLVAVALLVRLAANHFGERAGIESVLLLCVMPFGFFMNAVYTESLFLVLVLSTLSLAESKRWRLAGTAAGLAGGTRLVGLVLAPVLLYSAYRRGAKLPELVGSAALSISGAFAYFIYCAIRFDDFFAYFSAQAEWGGWSEHVKFYAKLFFIHPRQAVTGRPEDLIVLLNLAVGVIFLAFLPKLWRMGVPEIALLSTLFVVVQGALTWLSLGRYVLPAVGVYMAMALWLASGNWSRWFRDAVVVTSSMMLVTLSVLYATGFWVV